MLLSIEGYLEEVYPITSNYSYLPCYGAQKMNRTKRDNLRPLKVLQKKKERGPAHTILKEYRRRAERT
jgi:hypothetical protein